jgi:hypothetical protein
MGFWRTGSLFLALGKDAWARVARGGLPQDVGALPHFIPGRNVAVAPPLPSVRVGLPTGNMAFSLTTIIFRQQNDAATR